MDALAAREAVLVGGTHRRSRALVPSRAGNVPELRLRARCARTARGGPRAARSGDLAGATRDRRGPATAVRSVARRSLPRTRPARARAAAVRARRRDPAAAGRERGQDRPRDGALRRRSRDPPAARPGACPPGARGPAERRRRRRARVGTRPQRSLRRSAPLVAAGAQVGDARCPQAVPPRHDRAVSRPPHRRSPLPRQRARAEPAVLGCLVARGEEGPRMKRLTLVAVAVAALAWPALAAAHPLGNFTINRFSRIEVPGPRLYVRYVLDMAEIPTFQAGRIDPRAYARRIANNARLNADGRRVELTPVAEALAHPPGAGGLKTTRLEVVLRGPRLARRTTIRYADTNF